MRRLLTSWGRALLLTSLVAGFFGSPMFAADQSDLVQPVTSTAPIVQEDEKVDVDLTKLETRARVVYVSSGATAFTVRMIDNDVRTGFRFSGSDLHPTMIVELAASKPIHHVSAVFDPEKNARLDVYLLDRLPKKSGDLTRTTPIACAIDSGNAMTTTAGAEFAPNFARYVAFRWTREKSSRTAFVVDEVDAFGSQPKSEEPLIFAEIDLHFTGERQLDFSNSLGTLADPPIIAVVSP